MTKFVCTSCKTDITTVPDSTRFPCPNCTKQIVRCGHCRINSTKYKCPDCGFMGP